jgi:hypothetical protein
MKFKKMKQKIIGPLDRTLALAYSSDTMKENIRLKENKAE